MDKSTLSNYGWIVIACLVLCVMIALASPFGHFIEDAVKTTTQGLFDVQQKTMGAIDINLPSQSITETVYYGDVDMDGDVDEDDAVLLGRHILAPSRYPLTTEQTGRADVDGNGVLDDTDKNIIHQYINGEISSFPLEGVSTILYGDVDLDGDVDNDDTTLLGRYILAPARYPLTDEQLQHADVDGSGTVDDTDKNLINNYIDGLISKFPAEN